MNKKYQEFLRFIIEKATEEGILLEIEEFKQGVNRAKGADGEWSDSYMDYYNLKMRVYGGYSFIFT